MPLSESESTKEEPMEAGGGAGPPAPAKTPKTGFDKLSREELVTKCNQLLKIAQKAKNAKDEALADAQNTKKELKDAVLNLKKTEEARKVVSEEADAFRDMVTDLTEGKVVLTTKDHHVQAHIYGQGRQTTACENESLQRQLKLLTSEEGRLLQDNAALEEQLRNLQSSTSKYQSLAKERQKEKEHLMEQIESLTAKCTQVDVLKQKCKHLMQEKSDLEEKIKASGASAAELKKMEAQYQMLCMEKQAMDIVVKESQNQRKLLEDRVKSLEKQKSEFEKYKELENKVAELESQLKELENINKSLTDENRSLTEENQLNCAQKEEVERLRKEKEEGEREAQLVKEEKDKLEENMIEIQKELEFLNKEKSNFENQCKVNGEKEDLYLKEQLSAFEAKEEAFLKEKSVLCDKLKEKELEVQNEKEGWKAQTEEHQQRMQQMQERVEKLQQEHQELLASKQEEEHKALQLLEENKKIHDDHKQFQSDLSCAKENLTIVLKEKELLETEISKYRETVESYDNKVKDEDKKMKECAEKVENLSKSIEAKSEEIKMQIFEREKAENALKECDDKVKIIWGHFQNAFSSLVVNAQDHSEKSTAQAYLQNIECLLENVLAKQSQTDPDNRIEEICMLIDVCFTSLSKLVKGDIVEEESLVQLGGKFADNINVLYKGLLNVKENEEKNKTRLCDVFKVVPDLSKSIQDLHHDLKQRESCIKEKEVQLNDCENKLNEYEGSLKEFKTKLAQEKEIRTKLEVARVEETESKGSLEEELVKYRKQMDELKTVNDTMGKEKEECNNQITSLKEKLTQASEQIQALSSEKKITVGEKERLLEEMSIIKKNMESTSEDKDKRITDIQKENNKFRKEITHSSEEKKQLEERIKEMEQENESIKELLSHTTQNKSDLETKVAELIQVQNEYESLRGDLSKITQEKNKLEEELAELKKLHSKQKEELELKSVELSKKNAEIDEFRNESVMMKKAQELVEQKIKKQQQKTEKIECSLQDAQKQIETLDAEKTTCEKSLKEAQNIKEQLEASLQTSSVRCQELLTELNDMNSVLRERGERISRLEVASKEKDEQLKDLKNELADSKKMIDKIAEDSAKKEEMNDNSKTDENNSEEVNLLKKQIVNLEEEKVNMKMTIKGLEKELASGSGGGTHDTQSEVMSTSTISRMEDSQRMKDLDDTFEERFMKMKSIAIRLKKKVAELTQQLNSSEEGRKKLSVEREEMKKRVDAASKDKENLKALTKNIQVLQGEIDRLQDQVDSKAKDLKDQDKQLVAVGQQLADAKSQIANMQEENDQLKRTVVNLEETIKEQADASENVRGQVAALEKRLQAEADQREALEERRKKTDERVEEERTKRERLMKDLEEAKQDSKKSSLMDLEIRDYERTVSELTATIAEKDKELITLQNGLEHEKEHVHSLKDQITHLSNQEATERERAEKMKKLLLDHKSQLAELRLSQEKHVAEQGASRSAIEQLTQEVEKQKLVLAEVSSEKSRLEDYGRKIKTTGERQVELLEEQTHQQKEEIDQLNSQLKAVKEEFEGFKVRAHSVLRQKSKPQELNIDEVKAEKEQLQSECEAARLKIQQLQTEFAALRAEHGFLQAERDRNSKQVSSLSSQLTKMESTHHEKLVSLESNLAQKSSEYQQIISNMTSQNEMMSNSYKNQLESLKLCHTKEIEQLQLRIEELEDKLWEAKNSSRTPPGVSTPSVPQQVPHESGSNHRRQPSHGCEEPRLDVSNMIREEGEGSEWVEPVQPSAVGGGGTGAGHDRRYSPPPLDQLLSNPLQPLSRSVSVDDNTSLHSLATDITAKDTSHLESKISSYEIRVKQLTSLLHESEGENAKLQQLAEALKEEIRRSARNEDRQKHLENTEYLKNVVLKFLILKNSDEKKRLIPVLTTVLQLSPQEAGELQGLIADLSRHQPNRKIPLKRNKNHSSMAAFRSPSSSKTIPTQNRPDHRGKLPQVQPMHMKVLLLKEAQGGEAIFTFGLEEQDKKKLVV
ncbi:GRIP and coiled-coil domain containing 185 kDa isoform X3 [Oratosquilla oratoria]|uniref:GRIP and coiled-coil domain containing 185 kDa isoform X3 n=1 Tax=Oratosquilla oratoria TaxID=337810 RepID=UPI003F769388